MQYTAIVLLLGLFSIPITLDVMVVDEAKINTTRPDLGLT